MRLLGALTNDKWFNTKGGEQVFPSLAVTTERSARSDTMPMPIYRYSTTSQLGSNESAKILNGHFFIWRAPRDG